MSYAYIGFGSNIGDRRAHIGQAICCLSEAESTSLLQVSSIYETQPIGYDEQDWFLNGVIEVETNLSPEQLLGFLKRVEVQVGRRARIRWGPREIDLDLLIYNQLCINTSTLMVPHRDMHKRRFVLVPFEEIAPNTLHPVFRETIQTLLRQLVDDKLVRKIAPSPLSETKE